MNTAQLLEALRSHYLKPGEPRQGSVILTEVTAPNRTNRADAIHVGLWASRGYTVDVHELKVSRADFQRELDKPAKAEAWWRHSNTFWIVAPHESIAPPELLPHGWGLMVPGTRGRRFKKVVEAEHRPLQPSTALLAALLTSMETDLDNALRCQRDDLRSRHERELATTRRELASATDPQTRKRLALLDDLEKRVGFELADWAYGDRTSPEEMATAIREALLGARAARDIAGAATRLEEQADRLRQIAAEVRKELRPGAVASVARDPLFQ